MSDGAKWRWAWAVVLTLTYVVIAAAGQAALRTHSYVAGACTGLCWWLAVWSHGAWVRAWTQHDAR